MPVKFTLLIALILYTVDPAVSQTSNGLQNLDFGPEIFPGIEKSVSRTDASAAKYEISGEGGREVQITFQLPDYLTDGAGNSLIISFSSTDAGYNTDEAAQSEATAFDPNTGVVTTLSTDGLLYIWVGGTVDPLSSQAGNPYGGDLTINATYTN